MKTKYESVKESVKHKEGNSKDIPFAHLSLELKCHCSLPPPIHQTEMFYI